MKCIECGGKAKVLNSRNSGDEKSLKLIPKRYGSISDNFTYRDHKCVDCGATFPSIQLPAITVDDFEKNFKHRIKREFFNMMEDI